MAVAASMTAKTCRPPLPVGDDAGRQPPDRAVEHGDRGDPGQLDVGEAELLADRDAQDPEHQPDGEHQGEGDGRDDQDPDLPGLLGRGRLGAGATVGAAMVLAPSCGDGRRLHLLITASNIDPVFIPTPVFMW